MARWSRNLGLGAAEGKKDSGRARDSGDSRFLTASPGRGTSGREDRQRARAQNPRRTIRVPRGAGPIVSGQSRSFAGFTVVGGCARACGVDEKDGGRWLDGAGTWGRRRTVAGPPPRPCSAYGRGHGGCGGGGIVACVVATLSALNVILSTGYPKVLVPMIRSRPIEDVEATEDGGIEQRGRTRKGVGVRWRGVVDSCR